MAFYSFWCLRVLQHTPKYSESLMALKMPGRDTDSICRWVGPLKPAGLTAKQQVAFPAKSQLRAANQKGLQKMS